MQYPEFARQIPVNSRIVLLPGDDPELAQINRETAARAAKLDDEPDRPIVFVTFARLAPPRSRLEQPRLVRAPLTSA